MLLEGQDFREINDSYVIFITENDVIGAGKALYHVDRVIRETGEAFEDGSHIIYVNGSYKDDGDPVGRLMHDFGCISAEDMYYPALAKSVRYFKESEGGRGVMCKAFEELAEKRAAEYAAERIQEEKEEAALRMLETGKLSVEEVANCLELPVEMVEELAAVQMV